LVLHRRKDKIFLVLCNLKLILELPIFCF
jgi:hypothetical protein